MGKLVQINFAPSAAADEAVIKKIAASLSGIDQATVSAVRVIKRSVDARKKNIRVNLTVEVISGEDSSSHESVVNRLLIPTVIIALGKEVPEHILMGNYIPDRKKEVTIQEFWNCYAFMGPMRILCMRLILI